MVRLIALSADVVNRQINTLGARDGVKSKGRRAGRREEKRAEKGQNQHGGIEEVKKMREGIRRGGERWRSGNTGAETG